MAKLAQITPKNIGMFYETQYFFWWELIAWLFLTKNVKSARTSNINKHTQNASYTTTFLSSSVCYPAKSTTKVSVTSSHTSGICKARRFKFCMLIDTEECYCKHER